MGPDPGSAAAPAVRLAGLELLRWIAAMCVLLLHVPVIFGLTPVFGKGYLGVDLFFMLSGYVAAHGFAGRPANAQPAGRFIARRYLRMWPMMAVGGVIGLPLLYARAPGLPFVGMAVANLLLVPVRFQHETYPLNVPAWTIMFILFGNLAHRLVLHRWRMATLGLAIVGSAIAMAAVAAYAGGFDVGARPETIALALPRLALSYLVGIAVQRRRRWSFPPLLAVIAMPLLLVGAWWGGVTTWLFDMAFVIVACPLMIAGAARVQLGAAMAGFAGAWSFPLYALHFPLLIRLRNDGFDAWPATLIVLALSALATGAEMQLRARAQAGNRKAMVGRLGGSS